MIAFRTFWAACIDLFEELFLVFAANALWCAVAIPLPYLAVVFAQRELYLGMVVCALLAPLPFALASGGLTTLARRFVDGKATPWRELLSGVRVNMGQRVLVMYVWAESSKTRQSAGWAATLAATVRKISGDGLTALTSLDVTMVAKC